MTLTHCGVTVEAGKYPLTTIGFGGYELRATLGKAVKHSETFEYDPRPAMCRLAEEVVVEELKAGRVTIQPLEPQEKEVAA